MTPKVSKGNLHMGRVKSTSTRSGKDCDPPFLKKYQHLDHCLNCYGVACEKRWPDLKRANQFNSDLLERDPKAWINGLVKTLHNAKTPPKRRYFRFNIFGEIKSREHYEALLIVARLCPSWKFLVFTKAFRYVRNPSLIPSNLAVVLSIKHETHYPPPRLNRLPRAYCVRIGAKDARYRKDTRFRDAKLCEKDINCIDCGCFCWEHLKKLGKDVKFIERGVHSIDLIQGEKS